MDYNRTAFFLCGLVINCLSSPCSKNIIIGNSYSCDLHSTNLYWIEHGRGGIIFLLVILCILATAFLVLICNLAIHAFIFLYSLKQSTYEKVDDSSVDENIKLDNVEISDLNIILLFTS